MLSAGSAGRSPRIRIEEDTMPVSERFQGANIVDAGTLSPYWGEHAARYRYALPYVEGKRVLDIACGTGYGLGILKRHALLVVGVDRDPEGVAAARAECDGRASAVLGDGLALPFADGSLDVAVSFETIEHLHERKSFLEELHRVLRPGGTLVLSTPNAFYTEPVDGVPSNPFHVHEYCPEELKAQLSEFFDVEKLLGQALASNIKIPPFFDAQRRLPKDPLTQVTLFGWKVLNKLPFGIREGLSRAVWGKPFYPTEEDYVFSEALVASAPVTVAICRKT